MLEFPILEISRACWYSMLSDAVRMVEDDLLL